MSAAKHTPGPWRLSHEADTHVEAEASGNFVASCDGGGEDGEYETDLANARLIAAAPDLLEEHSEWASTFGEALVLALQGDYSKVDELAKDMPIHFPDGAATIRSAAIAKANDVSMESCGVDE